MATPSTVPVTATYSAGATPLISGAPVLPTPCKFSYRPILFGADSILNSRIPSCKLAYSGPDCTYW
jgi:hypothetical protein